MQGQKVHRVGSLMLLRIKCCTCIVRLFMSAAVEVATGDRRWTAGTSAVASCDYRGGKDEWPSSYITSSQLYKPKNSAGGPYGVIVEKISLPSCCLTALCDNWHLTFVIFVLLQRRGFPSHSDNVCVCVCARVLVCGHSVVTHFTALRPLLLACRGITVCPCRQNVALCFSLFRGSLLEQQIISNTSCRGEKVRVT